MAHWASAAVKRKKDGVKRAKESRSGKKKRMQDREADADKRQGIRGLDPKTLSSKAC